MSDMNKGAPVHQMVRDDDLRRGVMEEGVNGEEEDNQGGVMRRTSPLEEVISTKEGRGRDTPLVKSGDRTIIGLVE